MNKQRHQVTNPFVEKIKKFIGTETKVYFFNNKNEEEVIEGFCEAIDYVQKAVIIRTKDKKILIPRYKYLEKIRSNPEPINKGE